VRERQPGDEIIVVDDGSTDDTARVVQGHGERVRYLRTAHVGAGAARNAGIRAARCDLVAFLDSDDEWVPGKLAWQRAVLEHYPDVLFLFSDFTIAETSGERLHNQVLESSMDPRSGDEILGPGIPSETIPGLPASTPSFRLHVGRFYETYLRPWGSSRARWWRGGRRRATRCISPRM